jgi:hypothetical protein
MKSWGGRLFFAVMWAGMFGITLSREWEEFVEAHPGASAGDFAWSLAPFAGQVIVAVALVGIFIALVRPRLSKWSTAPKNPPPPDAGALYGVRTYPLHVAICLLLIGLTIALYFFWPGAAVVTVGLTIAAWVSLGHRLGFGPANDPAGPRHRASQ